MIMRKTLFFSFVCLICTLLTNCGGSLTDKLREGKELSTNDYTEMINYLYDAMSDMENVNRTANPYDTEELMEQIHEITEEYPAVPLYYEACVKAFREGNKNFNEVKEDPSKFARVMDCMARGWGKFW